MGSTVLLHDRSGFDAVFNQPMLMIDAFTQGMGVEETLEEAELPNPDLGELSSAITVVAVVGDDQTPYRFDYVAFRRESVGAFAFAIYADGDDPPVSAPDIAAKLDEQIKDAISASN
jgi:hypothetical protein